MDAEKCRWDINAENDEAKLMVNPFGEESCIAMLFRDDDGDWYLNCVALGQDHNYYADALETLPNLCTSVAEELYQHYTDEVEYNTYLANLFK